MKMVFHGLLVFTAFQVVGQDVIDLSSDSAKVLLKQWEKNTYLPVQQRSTEEKGEEEQLTMLHQGLENIYNSPSYRIVEPISMPPLLALQDYKWKNKSGKIVYDPKVDSLAPNWLVKSYLKKKSNPYHGKYAKAFKESYSVLQTENGEKMVSVYQLGTKRYKRYPREFWFPSSYVQRLGGNPRMVHWRSGILICQ